tara:strand:+ start:94 stop:1500 length:1407 start_codon:yes stop_codon:yes gene_type:complete
MKDKTGLVWIREDFRVIRNTALIHATHNHDKVTAFFVYKEKKFLNKQAQKWWIYKSIKNFKIQLKEYNINFQIIDSDSYNNFYEKLLKKKNFYLYWNRIYEPDYLKFDKVLIKKLKKLNINYNIFRGNILNEFQEVSKEDKTPFKVFTPFWRTAEKFYLEKIPPSEKKIRKCKTSFNFFSEEKNIEELFPNKNWYSKFEQEWSPSEKDALKQLKFFLNNNIEDYSKRRNFPSVLGTSKLSPYIKNGNLHVETIWMEVMKLKKKGDGMKKFLTEIGWREFSHSLINYFPNMLKENYSKKFDKFPWKKNDKFLSAWKIGQTGYPIVDAGMRELNNTGWMHNRVRMIVGSFLVKHLLIDWREGEKYFRNCLLDFSEANNVAGWQWVAGCGADAAPYFRIFNPILQGEKFDKDGSYVKKWVPELKNIPNKFIHKPWEYKDDLHFQIGKNYPKPIVLHEAARAKALDAFQKIK